MALSMELKSMFEQLEKLLEAHPELRWDNDRNMVAASDRMWANVLKVSLEVYLS